MKKSPTTKSIVLQRDDSAKVIARIEGGRIYIECYTRRIGVRDGKLFREPGSWPVYDAGLSLQFAAARRFAEWVLCVQPAAGKPAAEGSRTKPVGVIEREPVVIERPAWVSGTGSVVRAEVEIPEWVRRIDDDFLRDDLDHALVMRAISVERGANRRPKDRELLRRGDAILARVEKRPTRKDAMILIGEAEALYREPGPPIEMDFTWPEWIEAVESGALREALEEMIRTRGAFADGVDPKRLKRIDGLADKLARLVEAGERGAEVLAEARSLAARYERASFLGSAPPKESIPATGAPPPTRGKQIPPSHNRSRPRR